MKTPACREERRRDDVRARHSNGLDYLEVDDTQTELCVHFIDRIPQGVDARNVVVRGGRRRRDVAVVRVYVRRAVDPEQDDCLIVKVDAPGDFSTYELCLVETDADGRPTGRPFAGLDPRYACLCFSFKAACPTDLDCAPAAACAPERPAEPSPSYLAKDYESFRRLALDRLAVTTPDWSERHVPDVGVALVELLAYEADRLSYYQDAVGTEAYLGTARRRISARRHARLVDYHVHDGCNARAWLFLEAAADVELDATGVFFITRVSELPPGRALVPADLARVARERYEVFEPLQPADRLRLRPAHNRIPFYAWGERFCCLPKGTTAATLRDEWAAPPPGGETSEPRATKAATAQAHERARTLDLRPGDFLLFEELLSPTTSVAEDADPTHRHVVRLARVTPAVDPLYDQPVVEIEWAVEDALPFALCLSALGPAPDCRELIDVSVARGNLVLVDQGETVGESLGPVAQETAGAPCECAGRPGEVTPRAARFRSTLERAPLTFRAPLEPGAAAAGLLTQDPRAALPSLALRAGTDTWEPRADLLDSDAGERHVAVEVDDDGAAHLRFGDNAAGRAPDAGTTFLATYRVGNGPDGNVGAETIAHAVFRGEVMSGAIAALRNPLPAAGGTAPEPLDVVRLRAPHAFRRELQRAVTADDYARLAERDRAVQAAAAALRWSGSWYEADVGLDALGSGTPSAELVDRVTAGLEPYRRIGHDLRVEAARDVPLRLELRVCVEPHHLRGHVEAALLALFSARVRPDGSKGLFHPDNLSFGEAVSLSRLAAAAQAIEGVESVTVTCLERLFEGPNGELASGLLKLGPLEIARLDNDPSAPDNGVLRLDMRGGR